jgi:hypothetical protein
MRLLFYLPRTSSKLPLNFMKALAAVASRLAIFCSRGLSAYSRTALTNFLSKEDESMLMRRTGKSRDRDGLNGYNPAPMSWTGKNGDNPLVKNFVVSPKP